MTQDAKALSWQCAALTDQGKKRKHNEDALLCRQEVPLWVVADGMGGHAAGDVASRFIVECLEPVTPGDRLADTFEAVTQALDAANRRIKQYAVVEYDGRIMGTTVVCVYLVGRHGVCIWAGDSRLYRLREGVLEQLSLDHSEVQRMVEEGIINADEAENHPNANIILHAIGSAPDLILDTLVFDVRAGDRLLLCSDGLYNEVSQEEITNTLLGLDVDWAVETLIDTTLINGARDNVSVVVVEIKD